MVSLGHLLVPPQVEIEGVLQPLVLQLEGGVVLAELLVARQQLLQQPLVPVVVDCVGGQPVLQRVHVSLGRAHARALARRRATLGTCPKRVVCGQLCTTTARRLCALVVWGWLCVVVVWGEVFGGVDFEQKGELGV